MLKCQFIHSKIGYLFVLLIMKLFLLPVQIGFIFGDYIERE